MTQHRGPQSTDTVLSDPDLFHVDVARQKASVERMDGVRLAEGMGGGL